MKNETGLSDAGYGVIYADPPWRYDFSKERGLGGEPLPDDGDRRYLPPPGLTRQGCRSLPLDDRTQAGGCPAGDEGVGIRLQDPDGVGQSRKATATGLCPATKSCSSGSGATSARRPGVADKERVDGEEAEAQPEAGRNPGCNQGMVPERPAAGDVRPHGPRGMGRLGQPVGGHWHARRLGRAGVGAPPLPAPAVGCAGGGLGSGGIEHAHQPGAG